MHVAVLADFAEPSGGAQAVALQSAIALAAQGAAVTYIHATGPADSMLPVSGVTAVSLALQDVWDRPPVAGAMAGIWNSAARRRLAEALARLPKRETVLHLHQWTRSLSPSVFGPLLSSGRPLVVTLHDYFAACPNGVYYRFDRDGPCDLVPLSPSCIAAPCDPRSRAHKAVRVLRSAVTKAAWRGAAFDVVHVSDRGRDTLAPFLPPTLRQHRIDNPVDSQRGAPARIGTGSQLAYIGRLTREKGADLAAEAAREAGLPILFVGEGPAEADIRRIDPDARMLGWRSRAEVQDLLRGEIRAVVAPSRWYETGPLTVYEAMAAGVPAVASSRSGAAEKVSYGTTGLVVEPDVVSLAAAFRSLADPDVAARLGRAAFERYWADPPSPAAHATKLLSLYEGVLATNRAASVRA